MTIPAFLNIDVEPEAFQLDRRDPPAWAGYAAIVEYAERLRADLTARTGAAPRFGWYFRTDPQIAEIHGRPYLSLGILTDAAASAVAGNVRRIFDALPRHPLPQRLRFEDPLTTFRAETYSDLRLR
jgi:hypothetical protein